MSKYQWPASGLTEKEMEILFKTKQETRESICGLLKKAVHIAYSKEVKHGITTEGSGEANT